MSKTRTNQEWLYDLNASGALQEAAVADLRDLLLRAALYFFSRNLGDLKGLDQDEIMQRAEDCAQDALIAVMKHLPDFRGDSKFTTWAYKFAINKAMVASRRERWKGVSLDELAASDETSFSRALLEDRSAAAAPEQSAAQGELRKLIREVIEHELTEKQRQVLILMVFNEVPLDEVVRHFGTNRNAVYKMLHDARRKMKIGLQARGFDIGETITLFGASR
ncbi:MAG TPA: sigma-70 family RNA polymerase sigma factor [Anaerolineales bacterium]|nr:sigma-70 family RNA polymerase sigma factor [Anaerolineales bacterium]